MQSVSLLIWHAQIVQHNYRRCHAVICGVVSSRLQWVNLEDGGMIKAIDKGVVHRICSGQVILDLATAVKELVENAIDAGATTVEVRLKEHGSELIEIADNGGGVDAANHQSLTLKYHTSKLQQFSDLQEVSTFGFRGEALSSLCALATVTITTRTPSTNPAQRLTYDHTGSLVGTAPAARAVGTTVAVKDLFKTLPVRHKEFLRHIKREFAKLVTVLQAYALISTGVRMICTNQVGTAARSTVLSSTGGNSMRDNIVNVFGARLADGLVPLHAETTGGSKLKGFVSKAGAGSRGGGDRQFCYVNGRPVDLPKVIKAVNEAFRSLASAAVSASRPCLILNIHTPKDRYDVNVTPDKRKVFLHHEAEILQALQQALQQLWEPARFTYQVNNPSSQRQSTTGGSKQSADVVDPEEEEAGSSSSEDEGCLEQPQQTSQVVTRGVDTTGARNLPPKTFHAFLQPSVHSSATQRSSYSSTPQPRQVLMSGFVSSQKALPSPSSLSLAGATSTEESASQQASDTQTSPAGQHARPSGGATPSRLSVSTQDTHASPMMAQVPLQSPGMQQGSSLQMHSRPSEVTMQETSHDEEATEMEEQARPTTQQITFDLASLRASFKRKREDVEAKHDDAPGSKKGRFEAASLQGSNTQADDDNASAAQELDRVFNKANFPRMQIIGQFNLGFIVARIGRDLFIIDQHASDEKFNFERLASTTVLNKQPLLHPQSLDLSPGEALTVRDNLDVFAQNGFGIQELDNGQLALNAVPFSKNVTFGKDDVLELIDMMNGYGDHRGAMSKAAFPSAATLHRPSRVRAMLAMRACRSSIMIGTALDPKTMRKVVDHLGNLESPWNCPHGRPTMRHLAVL